MTLFWIEDFLVVYLKKYNFIGKSKIDLFKCVWFSYDFILVLKYYCQYYFYTFKCDGSIYWNSTSWIYRKLVETVLNATIYTKFIKNNRTFWNVKCCDINVKCNGRRKIIWTLFFFKRKKKHLKHLKQDENNWTLNEYKKIHSFPDFIFSKVYNNFFIFYTTIYLRLKN